MNLHSQFRPVVVGIALAGVLWLVGCHPPASSQQPDSPAGLAVTEGNGYIIFYRWKDGPTVMICCDVKPDMTKSDENASGPPWHRTIVGVVGNLDGRTVKWQFKTTDGRNIEMQLNGSPYEVSAGNVFLVTTQGGAAVVEQVQRDLSGVKADTESVKAFAAEDEEMRKVLGMEEK